MDVRTQDAIERLMRNAEMGALLEYVQNRRALYVTQLVTADPNAVSRVAEAQGMVKALDEVLRIPADAAALKEQRTA